MISYWFWLFQVCCILSLFRLNLRSLFVVTVILSTEFIVIIVSLGNIGQFRLFYFHS